MTTAQRTMPLPPKMDVADFLGWEGDGTGTRYELIDGVLRAMAPASDAHNTICMRLGHILTTHLDKHRPGCRVVIAPGVQPRVRAAWNFRIPDLGVTRTPAERGDVMTPEPILLIEVLSPTNANETWDNIIAYTTLPSVKEILVVHSTRVRAEVLRRDGDGNWPKDATAIEAGGTVDLVSISATFPVIDAYAGTHLAGPGPA
jgi:Uma2 family endonuclease